MGKANDKVVVAEESHIQQSCEIAMAAGVGSGFVIAACIWLIVIVLTNASIINVKDFSHDSMGGFVIAVGFAGAAFGLGIGCLVGSIVRYKIEMNFEKEKSLGRILHSDYK